jgi:hypothetical protein
MRISTRLDSMIHVSVIFYTRYSNEPYVLPA